MGKTVSSSVNPCTHGQIEGSDLIPYERAAALIGMAEVLRVLEAHAYRGTVH